MTMCFFFSRKVKRLIRLPRNEQMNLMNQFYAYREIFFTVCRKKNWVTFFKLYWNEIFEQLNSFVEWTFLFKVIRADVLKFHKMVLNDL